ncbi:MAG: methylenetetrahydrofolate reductase [NAD(P)H] [Rhodobiaceae bacterium]|nr:methylenetetrahydrofolate reductase [NAD(P)H] [Rhodobiaceae bacterium]MCC0053656.1 methylenetetrahydrofolate reductase [NAD(P)H] [Rhodobiaceae bacterium]
MSGVAVSFEIFPPRNEAAWKTLRPAMARLAAYRPEYVSVTYGAGGSTKPATLETVAWLKRETRLDVAGHLTCVGATRYEVDATVAAYRALGVRRAVALRGDPADGMGAPYSPHPLGYQTTADLVAALTEFGDMDVAVSAYPEKHPASPDFAADLDVLAAKAEAGARRAITQFFFDNESFYRHRDRVAARGIDVELVPGILPIGSFAQVASFAQRCGTHIPARLQERFAGLENDPDTQRLVAAAVAAEQVDDLATNGVGAFHFYTLNRAELTVACCRMLGLVPDDSAGAAA